MLRDAGAKFRRLSLDRFPQTSLYPRSWMADRVARCPAGNRWPRLTPCGCSIRPPSAPERQAECRPTAAVPKTAEAQALGSSSLPLSARGCASRLATAPALKPGELHRLAGSTPAASAGHDPAGRRGLPDEQVSRGSIPRWPTVPVSSSVGGSGSTRLALNQETAGSSPARSTPLSRTCSGSRSPGRRLPGHPGPIV
jgi:hypothetical protein